MLLLKRNCIIIVILIVFSLLSNSDAKKKVRKNTKGMILRQKETNSINFIRLAVMRLIYGIATRIGLGEQISEALNGAFVPPGVDDYDYGDDGIFSRDDLDDDDYDY